MNFFEKNLALSTDSYKASHACKSQNAHVKPVGQFPEGTEYTSYYIEARTEDEELVSAGMNFVAKVLDRGITLAKVNRANLIYRAHFGREIFNYEAWARIATEFNGKLPIDMWAVPEGTILPSKTPIAVIENTHPDYPWLPGNLETFVLRGIWYPTSVATKSNKCLKVLKKYMDMTSDLEGEAYTATLKTRLHDFGARGATSEESAAIGGLAHLYNFIGTDTVEALVLAQDLYNVHCAGVSIPAREHSTTIGYEDEDDAYLNSIELYGDGPYSCVMDSTDYEAAVERVCLKMKDKIIIAGGTFVFRPDSGRMIDNIMFTLNMLGKHFGYTRNSKGYKVLHPSVRLIQGDDINSADDIERVLSWMEVHRWSCENIAFGMGGGLLQKVNRDTHKFAMKLSAICINGVWRGVHKCPKGSEWKTSKKGRLRTIRRNDGTFETIDLLSADRFEGSLEMFMFLQNGELGYTDTLENIRKRIDADLK